MRSRGLSEPAPLDQFSVPMIVEPRLEALRQFYGHGLGLVELGSFEGHAGYSGVFFGLPDAAYHLEFTQHEAGSPWPAPRNDNLLVLLLRQRRGGRRAGGRLADLGYPAVEPENPYWAAPLRAPRTDALPSPTA
jgi:hypothetical protein